MNWGDWIVRIRFVSAGVAFLVLLLLLRDTMSLVDQASQLGASAIQVTQIYAERSFYAIITIGLALMVYVGTRLSV